MLNIVQPIDCTLSKSKVARAIKDYCYWYLKPYSPERTFNLELRESLAREHNFILPTPEQIASSKPVKRFDCGFCPEDEFSKPQEFKVHYDGKNFVASVPGTRLSKAREVYELTHWDDLFDSLYPVLKESPEFDEKGLDPTRKQLLRDRLFTVLVKQFYNIYCYDDAKEPEPCCMFISRKISNYYCRMNNKRQRFTRKVNNVKWSYWVTFTYDDDKCTEQSFVEQLLKKLQNLSTNYGWRYIGVFERGDLNDRLHFHGFIYVPEGTMPGELVERESHSYKRSTGSEKYIANTDFEQRFGRNSFESLAGCYSLDDLAKYTSKMMRYMDTGARFVYSRHIPFDFILTLRPSDFCSKFVIKKKVTITKYTVFSSAITRSDLSIARTLPILAEDPDFDPYCNGLL